jgi:hypothetical protein
MGEKVNRDARGRRRGLRGNADSEASGPGKGAVDPRYTNMLAVRVGRYYLFTVGLPRSNACAPCSAANLLKATPSVARN